MDAHRAAVRAIEAAEVMLAPGVTGDALDRAARDALAADGYGSWVLPHPVGHGLGASGGERPAIATGSADRVPDGAEVNLETGRWPRATPSSWPGRPRRPACGACG